MNGGRWAERIGTGSKLLEMYHLTRGSQVQLRWVVQVVPFVCRRGEWKEEKKRKGKDAIR